jgi:hypothetical protein
MKQIYGDESTINRVKNARPGDPHIYVNMDAINELPDEYEVRLEKVVFDFEKDFDDVGNGNYMPSPSLMNKIAEARGIEGTNDVQVLSIYEEININSLLCKPLDAEPTVRKQLVAKRVIKTGKVLNEDGTWRSSDPCSVDYNVWERCLIDWMKEEELTNGYDNSIVKNGEYSYFKEKRNGPHYLKGQYAYPIKYMTQYQRQRHLAEAMKFAQRIADTKARHIVIRVLAGLKTGYQKDELKDGFFIFAKIRRSREILKLETAADLNARSRGLTAPADESQSLLYGPDQDAEPAITLVDEPVFPSNKEEPVPTLCRLLIGILEEYKKNMLIPDDKKDVAAKVLSWLENNPEAEKDEKYWSRAINILKDIEISIPQEMRMRHSLY